MKLLFKKSLSALLAFALILVIAFPALAADASIVFKGAQDGFDFQPGSEYTATDLFDSFKNIMPGDQLSQTVRIRNEASDCDYIKLYMRAHIHDENGNPLSYSESFEDTDGKDQSGVAGQRDETVASMHDFLSQLTMRIYNGDLLIYDASPDQAGALVDNVLLGTLGPDEELNLTVQIDVPPALGNEYANRVGEVDWIFLAECIEFEKLTVHKVWDDNGYPDRPDSVTVHLLCDGESVQQVQLNGGNQWTYTWDELDDRHQWSVKEDTPEGYQATYSTEDNRVFITNYMDYVPVIPPEPVDLTVQKVWSDENDRQQVRPDSVTVTLYNGETAVEKISLGEWNGWTYSWTDLDGNGDWSVLETGIPKGYAPTYETSGDRVIITNSATLIYTGQLDWPVPVLGSLGVLLIAFGIFVMPRKKKNENA